MQLRIRSDGYTQPVGLIERQIQGVAAPQNDIEQAPGHVNLLGLLPQHGTVCGGIVKGKREVGLAVGDGVARLIGEQTLVAHRLGILCKSGCCDQHRKRDE